MFYGVGDYLQSLLRTHDYFDKHGYLNRPHLSGHQRDIDAAYRRQHEHQIQLTEGSKALSHNPK